MKQIFGSIFNFIKEKGLMKKWWFWLIIFVLLSGIIGGGSNSDSADSDVKKEENVAEKEGIKEEEESKEETATNEPAETVSSDAALQKELKDKYGIGEPKKFVKGDENGDWRVVVINNNTVPEDCAVEYANAYIPESGIHFIVNLGLKTTTRIRILPYDTNIIETRTTEYVDKEEHDAKAIGEGQILSEKSFNRETGEEYSTESDESAGVVDGSELVLKVKEAIAGNITDDVVINDVSFDGSNLLISVTIPSTGNPSEDLAHATNEASSITDPILDLEDQYTNTWTTITLDLDSIGKAKLDKSMILNSGQGKYFNLDDSIFQ